VGERVEALRDNLRALQTRINQSSAQYETIEASTTATSQRYHGTMAAINTRLQIGTTKGNPILINQWNEAQSDLEKIAADVSEMNSLANTVAGDAGEVGFLLESVQSAFELSGAIEEDHRQLTVLEDETSRTSVLANRLLNQLTNDINRQTAYVGTERMNLTNTSIAIKNGGFMGTSAGTRNYLESASADSASGERQALVIIRFDRDDVAYEQALYDAVSRTMQDRPQSSFDVVSVAPLNGNLASNQAKSVQNAERVLRSLVDMGLPASRVKLASTANANVASNEVHVYVR
jgi:phage gpG-like protein